LAPPPETACGCLLHYISSADVGSFQPANISFGLLPESAGERKTRIRDRRERHLRRVEEALESMKRWIESDPGLMAASPASQAVNHQLSTEKTKS
jgi:methylenetetrahydrofolate--tRNA-(uracil-5-)-methyltransferase